MQKHSNRGRGDSTKNEKARLSAIAAKIRLIRNDFNEELAWLGRTYCSTETPQFIIALQRFITSDSVEILLDGLENNNLIRIGARLSMIARSIPVEFSFLKAENQQLLTDIFIAYFGVLERNRREASTRISEMNIAEQLCQDPEIGYWCALRLARICERVLNTHQDFIDILYHETPTFLKDKLPQKTDAEKKFTNLQHQIELNCNGILRRLSGWCAENKLKIGAGLGIALLGFGFYRYQLSDLKIDNSDTETTMRSASSFKQSYQ